MKYVLMPLALLLFSMGYAQQTDSTGIDSSAKSQEVFEVVENPPEFPGGNGALFAYISNNLVYPESARKDGVEGRVVVSFIVNEQGAVTELKVEKGLTPECDEAALNVVRNMPNWIPAIHHGKPVKVKFRLPILFRLPR